MAEQFSPSTKAQLDKSEREHLEDVVTELRETVEADIRYQLEHTYELDEEDGGEEVVEEDADTRALLIEAVEREDGDKSWDEKFEHYIMGVGYTTINRLTALRCMEVRGFLDRPVTQFGDSGTTPAAEKLENEQYLAPDKAKIEAYDQVCRKLADEIEILFDQKSPYSTVDPEVDVFEELCRKLDEIPEEVWRADDVLGWTYEYYNRPLVEALDAKNTLEPDDVGPANQFYTPHWVVRMLADNSLGKLYLESTGQQSTVPDPESLSIEERKNRTVTPEDSPGIPELCTYLIPNDQEQDAPTFSDPSEIRVIDPACGSGHFLLYAFDIIERIWWAERPDIDRGEVPAKVLEHNLYGIDIDLRSCQLAMFNLYLKARTRAEEENKYDFKMPKVNIVCADAGVADVEDAVDVIDQITKEGTRVRDALDEIIHEFQTTEGLGSLLDVQGMLSEEFMQEQTDLLRWNEDSPHTLNAFLKQLQEVVEKHMSDAFSEQDLRSFLNLLVVLTQDYDVALMNPPYGSGGRMPKDVKVYVENHYKYTTEYYINFFEVCDRLVKPKGRIGMLVPRSFMFLKSFQNFREDLIGSRGSFDFLAEFGIDILDNATVRTAGTVVRSGVEGRQEGTFIRLEDVRKGEKERAFLHSSFIDPTENGVQRLYKRDLSEFDIIPGTPLSYWVPKDLRQHYSANCFLDAEKGGLEAESLGEVSAGLCTGDDGRFVRKFWEAGGEGEWVPFAKGGSDAWLLPRVQNMVNWSPREMESQPGGRVQNTDNYFSEALSYTVAKESGRRFGYLHSSSIFSHKGSVLIPDRAIWNALSYTNSHFFTYLMLAQTTERMWEIGLVSKVPWIEEMEEMVDLKSHSRKAVAHLISKRQYDFNSPHYSGPVIFDVLGIDDPLQQYDHPHRELRELLTLHEPTETVTLDNSLRNIGVAAAKHLERIEADLQSCADAIDDVVFDCFNISEDQRDTVLKEIAIRTNRDPSEREEYNPDTVTEPTEDFPEMVKDLILHLALRVVHEDNDGIVPLTDIEDEENLLARIVSEFKRIFGEHASARLAEVDQILGNQTAGEVPYPNLRDWLVDGLFDYHISRFDRIPILWRLSTERLVSDPEMEGFVCLVDYHQLSPGLFDRIESRYLEPLKAEYRERRTAADQRRSDASLPTGEQAEATEQYKRYESALTQINEFQGVALELSSLQSTEMDESILSIAGELKPKVADFRARIADRLNTLDKLAEEMDPDDFEDHFSPTFLDRVNENRNEWLDALQDLETACEAYSQKGAMSIEAHLYDLFPYFDDLVGSTHYGSNGIFIMDYYFSKGEKFLEKGKPRNGLEGEAHLKAELAAETNQDVALGEEIKEGCNKLANELPSDWEERALQEIMASGYSPIKKHGVAINIHPLAEHRLVPESVENKVL